MSSRLARCARWLGLGRNPLRRAADRAEAAIRVTVLVLLVAAGRQAGHAALRQARAQAAAGHPGRAVLLRQAPTAGPAGSYPSAQVSWVAARWKAPGGAARTGDVLVQAGTPQGRPVPVWVSNSGALTDPPPGRDQVADDIVFTATLTCLGSVAVLLGAQALAVRALDRRRLSAWDSQ